MNYLQQQHLPMKIGKYAEEKLFCLLIPFKVKVYFLFQLIQSKMYILQSTFLPLAGLKECFRWGVGWPQLTTECLDCFVCSWKITIIGSV